MKTDAPTNSIEKVVPVDTTISNKEISKKDSVVLKISKNEEDLPINEYKKEELKPIRANFKTLNSITEWTSVDKRKLENIPENGVAEYYFLGGSLQKIIAHYPDKKEISEFYLLNGHLSMAVFKSISENDYKKVIIEKNYFKDLKLLHQINNQDCGSPFAEDYVKEEQKRILGIYNQIKSRFKK